jgi:hypothetical protein
MLPVGPVRHALARKGEDVQSFESKLTAIVRVDGASKNKAKRFLKRASIRRQVRFRAARRWRTRIVVLTLAELELIEKSVFSGVIADVNGKKDLPMKISSIRIN